MLELSHVQLARLQDDARAAFRAELAERLAARPRAPAWHTDAGRWAQAIAEAEGEGWEQGLRERDVLEAYVEARVVVGVRPWPEAVERWLRPGEAAASFRLASFVAAVHEALSER